MVPYTTVMKKIRGVTFINNVTVSAASSNEVKVVADRIATLLRVRHRLQPGDPDDFMVRTIEEMASVRKEATQTMTALLASIAGVSLLVGGIGIMNIMLVSVTERTREIGLRMAIGARGRDVLLQFLVEAVVLSLFGEPSASRWDSASRGASRSGWNGRRLCPPTRWRWRSDLPQRRASSSGSTRHAKRRRSIRSTRSATNRNETKDANQSCSRLGLARRRATLPGCSFGEASPQQQQGNGGGGQRQPAVPVTVAPVEKKSMPLQISVIGAAEAYSTVAVHAQITGELMSVNFNEGDDVKMGQVLFALDRRPLEAALQQSEANLARDLAQAANARAQAVRYQDLAERGIATASRSAR